MHTLGNRHFVVVVTRDTKLRLRFGFMLSEHGLLHDDKHKKTYAIVAEAYVTNWPGKWAHVYLVWEEHAQTVQMTEETRVDGRTVTIDAPLALVVKKRLPGPRGEEGDVGEIQLTAESIYDRTRSVIVRRLGQRRIQWFHAVLFGALGSFLTLVLVAAILMFSGGSAPPPPVPQTPGTVTLGG